MAPRTDTTFDQIAITFLHNLGSVRTLSDEVARLADAHDKQHASKLVRGMLQFLGAPVEQIEAIVSQVEVGESTTEPSDEPDDTIPKVVQLLFEKVAAKYPSRVVEFDEVMDSVMRGTARQGQLLRRGSVTLLVSFFDTLISQLVRAYYLSFPNALPADSFSMTLSELRRIGSVNEAERYIAGKESEKLLRESFETQMKFFGARFKIEPSSIPRYSDMLEITQRRNVIVHNDALVNRIYLESTPKDFIQKHNIVEGARLANPPEYLDGAVDATLTVGFFLLQKAWRWWSKDLRGADIFAVNLVYRMAKAGRCDLAVAIAEITESLGFGSDEHKRMLVINHAIALRDLGRTQEMATLLESLDWSASSLRFRAVVAAVRGDGDKFAELAPKALAAGELQKYELLTWIAFTSIRESPSYLAIITQTDPS